MEDVVMEAQLDFGLSEYTKDWGFVPRANPRKEHSLTQNQEWENPHNTQDIARIQEKWIMLGSGFT